MFRSSRNKSNGSARKRDESFISNGAAVLEQIIRSFNGDCNPIRSYSVEELENATNSFQLEMHSDLDYIMYQGVHRNRKIAVKKFMQLLIRSKKGQIELLANEIAIASRMSKHKNVLKLIGCCFESELPILVYEFPDEGNLGTSLFNQEAELSWDQKLKIVIQIANSVAYLHHGLPNAFIHRDIKPRNVFLDRNLSPKLFDFQFAVQIPEGEPHIEVEILAGTRGYSDPVADYSGRYTEKSDVYSFGSLLCDVLTEERIIDLRSLHLETISSSASFGFDDFVVKRVEERCKDYLVGDEKVRVQVMEYVKLMQRCLESNPGDRPDMIKVETELRRIKRL